MRGGGGRKREAYQGMKGRVERSEVFLFPLSDSCCLQASEEAPHHEDESELPTQKGVILLAPSASIRPFGEEDAQGTPHSQTYR